ncbi:MAG: hypothetical protein EHM45_22275 [Desulfobacteraceae bacterium]|nr:MAG: hypothetical protein EHM45_22275 [Desulfobacteraceae bacterium]
MNRIVFKRNFDWKAGCFFILFVALGLCPGLNAFQDQAAPGGGSTITIAAKSHEGDLKNKVAWFIGDVDAHFVGEVNAQPDEMTLRCQKMTVYFAEQPKAKAAGKEPAKTDKKIAKTGKIDKIVAKTDVVVIRHSDGTTLHCDEAVFYWDEEKIEATGNPLVLKQSTSSAQGLKLILFLKTDKYKFEGPSTINFNNNPLKNMVPKKPE